MKRCASLEEIAERVTIINISLPTSGEYKNERTLMILLESKVNVVGEIIGISLEDRDKMIKFCSDFLRNFGTVTTFNTQYGESGLIAVDLKNALFISHLQNLLFMNQSK